MSNLWIWKILQTHNKLIQKGYNKENYSDQTAVYTQPYLLVYFNEYWESVCTWKEKGKKSPQVILLMTQVWKPLLGNPEPRANPWSTICHGAL